MKPQLKFTDRYAAILRANRQSELPLAPPSESVSLWAYTSPDEHLIVVLGDRHTEPVLDWLHKAHKSCNASSLLGAVMHDGVHHPPEKDFYLVKAPLDEVLVSWDRNNSWRQGFLLLEPSERVIFAFLPSKAALDLSATASGLGLGMAGFVFRQAIHAAPVQTVLRSDRPYDPIAARIGEVINRASVACRESIQELGAAWKIAFGGSPPADVVALEEMIPEMVQKLQSDLHQGGRTENRKRHTIQRLQMYDYVIERVNAQCSRHARDLEEYVFHSTPAVNTPGYARVATPSILYIANNTMQECLARAALADRVDAIAVLGAEFGTEPLALARAIRNQLPGIGDSRLCKPDRECHVVAFPRHLRFRLGALPLLAHFIAHIVLGFQRANVALDMLLRQPVDDPVVGPMIERLEHNEDHVPQAGSSELLPALVKELIQSELNCRKLRFAEELVVDMVATALIGPAYCYAFARFLPGLMLEPDSHPQDSPSLHERLTLCLAFLRKRGFEVPFDSAYLKAPNAQVSDIWAQLALDVVPKPYTASEHKRGIAHHRVALAEGQCTEGSPAVLFNVLWEAVATKSSYINEMAMLVSLLQDATKGG